MRCNKVSCRKDEQTMSFDPNNLLREIDQLEANSRNTQRKISEIEQRLRAVKEETDQRLIHLISIFLLF